MTNPPTRSAKQKDYVHSAVRLPPELNNQIKEAAGKNGRSMNAEIIARLSDSPSAAILAELAELKGMIRKILDQI